MISWHSRSSASRSARTISARARSGTSRRAGCLGRWHRPAGGQAVDLAAGPAHRQVENWSLDRDVGAMALRKGGGAVLALDDGFYFFDLGTGSSTSSSGRRRPAAHAAERRQVRPPRPLLRRRDGRQGGARDLRAVAARPRLSVTMVDAGIICSNGPCWSPDNRTFYLADTFQGEYWAYDYDIATGSARRTSACSPRFKDDAGVADGSTIDDEGCLWNAQLSAASSSGMRPTAPSSGASACRCGTSRACMFGGDRLDELYVTSMARVKHPAVHDPLRRRKRSLSSSPGACSR